MANEVTLTFAGDSADLEKAFDRVGAAADTMGKEVSNSSKRVASSGVDTTRSLDRVGEGFDTLDTRSMGFRDAMTGAQDSMLGVAAVAKGDLFEGLFLLGAGIGDSASAMYNLGVPALKAMRDGARSAATAVANFIKTSRGLLVSLGALGLAVGAAVLAYQFFNREQKETIEVNQELVDTLDDATGAVTEDTRAWVANRLEKAGALEAANRLGIGLKDITDIALTGGDAYKNLRERINNSGIAFIDTQGKIVLTDRTTSDHIQNIDLLQETFQGLGGELVNAQGSWERTTEAVDGATTGILSQIDSLEELADTLKAQSDPIFAFIDSQNQVNEAQNRVNEAVKEFGRGSPEHEQALLDLAKAELGLFDATADAAGAVRGSLIPALEQMERDGLISAGAADALRDAIKGAERAAHQADGTQYTIEERFRRIIQTINQAPVNGRNVPGMQHGGLHAGGLAIVGEAGPELVDLPAGSRVFSHEQSRAMISEPGSFGGGPTVLEIRSGGSQMDDLLVQILSRAVRVRGGDVNMVLGGAR